MTEEATPRPFEALAEELRESADIWRDESWSWANSLSQKFDRAATALDSASDLLAALEEIAERFPNEPGPVEGRTPEAQALLAFFDLWRELRSIARTAIHRATAP